MSAEANRENGEDRTLENWETDSGVNVCNKNGKRSELFSGAVRCGAIGTDIGLGADRPAQQRILAQSHRGHATLDFD